MKSLQHLKDTLARSAHGMTLAEALTQGICIACHRPEPLSRCYSPAGRREYYISGLCEECFDSITREPPEDDSSALSEDTPAF